MIRGSSFLILKTLAKTLKMITGNKTGNLAASVNSVALSQPRSIWGSFFLSLLAITPSNQSSIRLTKSRDVIIQISLKNRIGKANTTPRREIQSGLIVGIALAILSSP